MPLPCIPQPPICRDTAACIGWLGLAHATCVDTIRFVKEHNLKITPEAEYILLSLREWLYFAFVTERQRRKQKGRGAVTSGRTWFCYSKYEDARKSVVYDEARQTVWLQTGAVQQVPSTTL